MSPKFPIRCMLETHRADPVRVKIQNSFLDLNSGHWDSLGLFSSRLAVFSEASQICLLKAMWWHFASKPSAFPLLLLGGRVVALLYLFCIVIFATGANKLSIQTSIVVFWFKHWVPFSFWSVYGYGFSEASIDLNLSGQTVTEHIKKHFRSAVVSVWQKTHLERTLLNWYWCHSSLVHRQKKGFSNLLGCPRWLAWTILQRNTEKRCLAKVIHCGLKLSTTYALDFVS